MLATLRAKVDHYRIAAFVCEGHGSILYRAHKGDDPTPLLLRLFKPNAHVDETVAARLQQELDALGRLPAGPFVRHLELKRSSDGDWYRVSEWIDTLAWGDLMAAGAQRKLPSWLPLFARIAKALATLHEHGFLMPHLILADLLIAGAPEGPWSFKLDFKLSRFLSPGVPRPPQLRRLLDRHPDVLAKRPLDARSDVWSLGKLLVEILAGTEDIEDYAAALARLPLPARVTRLIKKMLASDPDQRPGSMLTIAAQLESVTGQEIDQAKPSRPRVRRSSRWVSVGLGVAGLCATVLSLARRYPAAPLVPPAPTSTPTIARSLPDEPTVMSDHARRYSSAVALVASDYWLKVGGKRVYHNISQGTAFLADTQGRLVTNRHVACPWLHDSGLSAIVTLAQRKGRKVSFETRTFLWFDGTQALKQARDQFARPEVDDLFRIDTAYDSQGSRRLATVGVAPEPVRRRQALESPLGDDVAILQVTPPPEGIAPIPLATRSVNAPDSKLASVLALGYPLGFKSISDTTISASATLGHIRRVFNNLIQADVSIHPGNSGGPVVNREGQVVGIASAVSLSQAGLIPVPQSDLSLILPIDRALRILHAVQAGHAQWDGAFDPNLGTKLKPIFKLARTGKWHEARAQIDRESNAEADTLMLAAVLHFCDGDPFGARHIAEKAAIIYPEHVPAIFLRAWMDWREGGQPSQAVLDQLLAIDWRSPFEIYGYLARLLSDRIRPEDTKEAWDDRSERALLDLALAVRHRRSAESQKSAAALRDVLANLDDENWAFVLALNEMEHSDEQGGQLVKSARVLALKAGADNRLRDQRVQAVWLKYLLAGNHGARAASLRSLVALDPSSFTGRVAMTFNDLEAGAWSDALKTIERSQARAGRESANRLGMQLVHAQVLQLVGRFKEAQAALVDYRKRIAEPWYSSLAGTLLGEISEDEERQRSGDDSVKQLTLEVALGLKAEANKDTGAALDHYHRALESTHAEWAEYKLAKERILQLRKASAPR